MKIKAAWIITAAVGAGVALAAYAGSRGNEEALHEIKTGKVSLFCQIKGQEFSKIDPNKVERVGMADDTGVIEYEFTNGFSRTCYTVTNK